MSTTLTTDQQNIFDVIGATLKSWGLGSLANTVKQLLTSGLNQDAIMIQLQDTDAWKQRFAGNELRKKNGLQELSPAEYLSTEEAIRSALKMYGMPDRYQGQDQYAKWIGNGVSANELQSRIQKAHAFLASHANPYDVQALKDYYGMSAGQMVAALLDPTGSADDLAQMATTAQIGGLAKKYGLSETKDRATELLNQGYTMDQLDQGLSNVAAVLPQEKTLAQRFGLDYTQADAENEMIGGLASAARKRRDINQKEQALFAGAAGTSANALGGSSAGGY